MQEKKGYTLPSFGVVVQIAFWVLVFGFIFSLSVMVLDWPDAFYRTLLTLICHLVNFYFFYRFLIPRYFEKGKYLHSLASGIVILVFITLLRMKLERFFVIDAPAISVRIGTEARIGFVLFSEVTIAAFASLLRLAVNSDNMKIRLKDMEKSQLETELRFLKSQMSPHFLFNSINNIYSLVLIKSNTAPQALMKLSALLRYLLYECDHRVSIAREVEALKTYQDLYQLKFQDPIRLNWDIRVSHPEREIEPLLLVPLLENAIKHSGIGDDPEAEINMSISSDDNMLKVKTDNTRSSFPVSGDDEPGGIGLANIQKRLERIFPKTHQLKISQSENRFILYLEVPLL